MSTNIVIALDKRHKRADGTYPIIMRIGHNRTTTSIALGISVKEKDWDDRNRLIKKSYSGSVTRLNNSIQTKKAEAMNIIVKLQDENLLDSLSVKDIKQRITQQQTSSSFFLFAESQIHELIKAGRLGTARSYKGVVRVLKTYNKERDMSFRDLNYRFLAGFETYHMSKGLSYNGLSVYLRALRAIYNKAIKAGVAEKDLYPFHDYKIKTVPTDKRALKWGQLKKIIALELTPNHECFHARNYFVASYLMYGMNFTDMAHLKKSNIINGRIKYRRQKTSKLYDIKITETLEKILEHYHSTESTYIFPIIKRGTLILQDRDIRWARKRYNKTLKQIADMCGIEENLTSYVSRHSFATQAMLQQVPINAISAMLGHSSIKTTEIYLKSLPTEMLDDYNALIIKD